MLAVSVRWSTSSNSAAFMIPLSCTSSLRSAISRICCMSWTLLLFSNTGFPVLIAQTSSPAKTQLSRWTMQLRHDLPDLQQRSRPLRPMQPPTGTYPQVKVFTVYLL